MSQAWGVVYHQQPFLVAAAVNSLLTSALEAVLWWASLQGIVQLVAAWAHGSATWAVSRGVCLEAFRQVLHDVEALTCISEPAVFSLVF